MTTILLRKVPGGKRSRRTFEKGIAWKVPGGPRKSIQAESPPISSRVIGSPVADSAATRPKLFNLRVLNGTLRIVAPGPTLKSLLPACASTLRSTDSPPKMLECPCRSTSSVARVIPPILPTALIRALSWRGVVGSVNWTS